jgi:hypothetical protein
MRWNSGRRSFVAEAQPHEGLDKLKPREAHQVSPCLR